MRFTIFGGHGFIGSNLERILKSREHEVFIPTRACDDAFDQDLGTVIYAIGLTSDFREKLFDTVDSHVSKLARLLAGTCFDSWLYLSSTRVYGGLSPSEVGTEDSALAVKPTTDGVYDISKLLGEALCLSHPNKRVRVARLSNVVGFDQNRDTFLGSIIQDLIQRKKAIIKEAPESKKDYIVIEDVIDILIKIATSGTGRLYNVASGKALTHIRLVRELTRLTGCQIEFSKRAMYRAFPKIDISKITSEFGFRPIDLTEYLPQLWWKINRLK